MPPLLKPFHLLPGLAALALLVACGGGGGSDDTYNSSDGSGSSALFVADTSVYEIGAYPNRDPGAGSTVAGKTLSVSGLGGSIAYDSGSSSKDLYLVSGTQVRVISGANSASGTPAYSRTITLNAASVTLTTITGIYLDKAGNRLYVGGATGTGGAVAVINSASTATGAVTPARVLTISDGVKAFAVDAANSRMYVLNPGKPGVELFDISGSGSGTLPVVRTLLPSVSGLNLAVDGSRSRLYVVDISASPTGIHIVNNPGVASWADQGTLPIYSIQYLTLDPANDRLYVSSYSKAYIFNSASSQGPGSTLPAAVTFSGLGSSLAGFAF